MVMGDRKVPPPLGKGVVGDPPPGVAGWKVPPPLITCRRYRKRNQDMDFKVIRPPSAGLDLKEIVSHIVEDKSEFWNTPFQKKNL